MSDPHRFEIDGEERRELRGSQSPPSPAHWEASPPAPDQSPEEPDQSPEEVSPDHWDASSPEVDPDHCEASSLPAEAPSVGQSAFCTTVWEGAKEMVRVEGSGGGGAAEVKVAVTCISVRFDRERLRARDG